MLGVYSFPSILQNSRICNFPMGGHFILSRVMWHFGIPNTYTLSSDFRQKRKEIVEKISCGWANKKAKSLPTAVAINHNGQRTFPLVFDSINAIMYLSKRIMLSSVRRRMATLRFGNFLRIYASKQLPARMPVSNTNKPACILNCSSKTVHVWTRT